MRALKGTGTPESRVVEGRPENWGTRGCKHGQKLLHPPRPDAGAAEQTHKTTLGQPAHVLVVDLGEDLALPEDLAAVELHTYGERVDVDGF